MTTPSDVSGEAGQAPTRTHAALRTPMITDESVKSIEACATSAPTYGEVDAHPSTDDRATALSLTSQAPGRTIS